MLGARIRQFREARGWTRADLANETMLAEITVRHLECGLRPTPRLSTLAMLAGALDMSLDELVGPDIADLGVSAQQARVLRRHGWGQPGEGERVAA